MFSDLKTLGYVLIGFRTDKIRLLNGLLNINGLNNK